MKFREWLGVIIDEQTEQAGVSSKDGKNNHDHNVYMNENGDGYTSYDENHVHMIIKGDVKTSHGHTHDIIKGER